MQKSFENIPNKGKPIPFVIITNKKFIITEEAKQVFHSLDYHMIGIVALVGKYRTGKSFLMNRVLLNQKNENGFDVGPTIKPCTKGIWMWSEPIWVENNHCKDKFPVFLIDTEGLSAYDEEINHDTKIFLIAVLISSLFIYNTFGNIDENAINSLNFILNLSMTLKISENEQKSNENIEEYSKYFPSLLWLLRDFSLKLEDVEGNTITVREYLENALQLQKGNSPSVEEKNKLRRLITTYFRDRDCFSLVRPVEKEKDLQNLQKLEDSQIRPEFIEQSNSLRNKVLKKVRPKTFNNKLLSGSRLIELIQSIVDSINSGSIPIIENSWKYVIQTECIKNLSQFLESYKNKIKKFKEENEENPTFFSDFETYQKSLEISLIEEFQKISADEEIVQEFLKKLKSKINEENKIFSEENRKLFEKKLNESLEINTKKLIEAFDTNKYAKNYYQFFQDLENLKEISEAMIPDFAMKKEIIFEKMLEIIKKFIEMTFIKNKILNEKEILTLKKDLQSVINKLEIKNEEFSNMKSESLQQIEKLNSQLIEYKFKEKIIEEKVKEIEKDKKNLQIETDKKLGEMKKENENKLFQMKKDFINLEEELKSKEEKIISLQFSEQKFNIINNQKLDFLEREINSYKDRFEQVKKENLELKKRLEEETIQKEELKSENNKIKILEHENERLKRDLEKNTSMYRENSGRKISNREKDTSQNLNNTRLNLVGDLSYENCSNINLKTNPVNIIETELCEIPSKQNKTNENVEIVSLLKTQLDASKNQIEEIKRMYEEVINTLKSRIAGESGKKQSQNQSNRSNVHLDCVSETEYLELLQANKNLTKSLANSENRTNKLEESLMRVKNKIGLFKSASALQCQICQKLFTYDVYKSHVTVCQTIRASFNSNNQNGKKNLNKLNIKILKGVLSKDQLGKPFIEYIIEISYNTQNWRVNRKFNQIANLHKTLKNYLNEFKFPESSLIFSKININGVDQNNFHENKIKYLERYLKDISDIDVINKSKIFRKFFDFEDCCDVENYISNSNFIEDKGQSRYNKDIMISTIEDYEPQIVLDKKINKVNFDENIQISTERRKSHIEESDKNSQNSYYKKANALNNSTLQMKKIQIDIGSVRRENLKVSKSPNVSSQNLKDNL